MSDALDRYIQAGEGISVEFKRCGSQPGKDTFETICSFACVCSMELWPVGVVTECWTP